jgi:hypothetical protein
MELSTLTNVLTAFISDKSNVITPDVWNIGILKNPVTTDSWIAVKSILDGIFMYQTKAKVIGYDIMEVPKLDKKLYAIKKYLDANWLEFVHEEKGVYAHNLFMEFLICFYSRTIIFQRDIFPQYHSSASEHRDYDESMKIDAILNLGFKQVVENCPDRIKLRECLRLEAFQAKQFSPMMSDGNSYYYVLGLVAAQICSKLKDNYLSSHPEMVTNTSGYTPKGYQLEYTGTDPARLSEMEVSRVLGSHGDEVQNLEFILEYLSLESKFAPEHVALFYESPVQFYFDALNNFQINLIQKVAKNEIFKEFNKDIANKASKTKQAWAKRPYVQELLLEDLQSRILSELEPEEEWESFENHEEIMQYFDMLITPHGFKKFMADTKNEIRTNIKLDKKIHDMSNLHLITPDSYRKMFEVIKKLYLQAYDEYLNSQNVGEEVISVVNMVLNESNTPIIKPVEIEVKPEKPKLTNFDSDLFLSDFADDRKYNFVREALNKTIFYLNKAAIIASESNPNNLLATLVSLILFPDKFSVDGAIFAKSKISVFQSNTGILQEGDLEIKVTDKVRIFLRDAGNRIQVVFVGNPTYH